MATSKLEIPIYQLPGEIKSKFQWLNLHIMGPVTSISKRLGLIRSDHTGCVKSNMAASMRKQLCIGFSRLPGAILYLPHRFGRTVFSLIAFECWTSEM